MFDRTVYFDSNNARQEVLCISTSLQVLAAPESWSNNFFQSFSTFFFLFKPFSVISGLKSTKNIWKLTKKVIFVYSSKLVDMQMLVDTLRGCLEIVFFQLIFYFVHFQTFFVDFRHEITENGWKRLKAGWITQQLS